MRRLTPGVITALITFTIGSAATTAWIFYRDASVRQSPQANPCLFPSLADARKEHTEYAYFPQDTFAADSELGPVRVKNYSEALTVLDEPSLLFSPTCVEEVYRFSWLRAFDPPVVVRIWQSNGSFFLVAKHLDRYTKSFEAKARSLSQLEWLTFKALLREADYWQLPTVGGTLYGYDGAQWIVEGVRQRQYHIVDRWSPEDKDYRAACVYLVKISGLDIDQRHYEKY